MWLYCCPRCYQNALIQYHEFPDSWMWLYCCPRCYQNALIQYHEFPDTDWTDIYHQEVNMRHGGINSSSPPRKTRTTSELPRSASGF
jgi:hypothetical protein